MAMITPSDFGLALFMKIMSLSHLIDVILLKPSDPYSSVDKTFNENFPFTLENGHCFFTCSYILRLYKRGTGYILGTGLYNAQKKNTPCTSGHPTARTTLTTKTFTCTIPYDRFMVRIQFCLIHHTRLHYFQSNAFVHVLFLLLSQHCCYVWIHY